MDGKIARKLPEANDFDERMETTFSVVYPQNKEFNHVLMPQKDIQLGFVSFKRARVIGPIKNFQHKLNGKFRDPISLNENFFRDNPHLK